MRFLFACLFFLALSGTALACGSQGFLNHHDEAFADVIFEGEIKAIRPTIYWNSHSEREQVRQMELIFDVSSVLRGELREEPLIVGWKNSFGGYPKTFEEFTKRYGTRMRVALTTPRQVEKFCRNEFVKGIRRGEKYEEMRWSCDVARYGGFLDEERATTMPFILNGACTNPYMFHAEPELSVEEFAAIARPYGRILLGWEEISFRVVQQNLDYLSSPLEGDSDKLEHLIEESKKLAAHEGHFAFRTGSTDKEKAQFVRMISYKFVSLSDLFNKDPVLRERYKTPIDK